MTTMDLPECPEPVRARVMKDWSYGRPMDRVVRYNDWPGRTQQEMLDLCDRAVLRMAVGQNSRKHNIYGELLGRMECVRD